MHRDLARIASCERAATRYCIRKSVPHLNNKFVVWSNDSGKSQVEIPDEAEQ
jgi:hypothetical protein